MKEHLKKFSYYLVDFFMSVLIGLGISILLDMPMKFIQVIDIDLGHFIVHSLSTCIVLYIRCYRRGYHTNHSTSTFRFRKALLYVAMVFISQVILVLILGVKNGGHAIYIAGPSRCLASYVLALINPSKNMQYAIYCQLNWSFMLLIDIFIYAPIMILGEYWGDKQNRQKTT